MGSWEYGSGPYGFLIGASGFYGPGLTGFAEFRACGLELI